VSSGADPAVDNHCFSNVASVPAERSLSTACETQAVSALPLSSTAPNCSGVPLPGGSWPTILASCSSAEVM
jgi:hypothetical protein